MEHGIFFGQLIGKTFEHSQTEWENKPVMFRSSPPISLSLESLASHLYLDRVSKTMPYTTESTGNGTL